jgi:quercetin dioxygenase-like cupin family protein
MFRTNAEAKPVEMAPGVTRRTLNNGDQMTLVEVTADQGAEVPLHVHPHEQIGYIARGRLLFTIGDETKELVAGDSYLMPGNVPHGGKALEPTVAIDIFSPPREEYAADLS